jgi:hypothetical protein
VAIYPGRDRRRVRLRSHPREARLASGSVQGSFRNTGPPDVSWSASRVPLRLLDVEQHENGGDNDDIQEQPDNGDRVVGIALVARRVFRQRR